MDYEVTGLDCVSKWQGVMDHPKAVQAGARYEILRAGSVDNLTGECYQDFQWQRNKVEGPANLPCGAFWYFRPNHSPTMQADYFLSLVEGVDLKLGLEIDVEEHGGLSPMEVSSRVMEFNLRILSATGKLPMIYTRGLWWNLYVAHRAEFGQSRLCVARYNSYIDGPWSDNDKYRPKDWTGWDFWQQTDKANGPTYGAQSPTICLGVYHGSLEEFNVEYNVVSLPSYAELCALVEDHERRLQALEGVINP